MLAAAEFGTPLDSAAVAAAVADFQTAWGLRTRERPATSASGASPVALAAAALAKYATWDAAAWTALPDTDVAVPPRGDAWVHIGAVGDAAVGPDCPFTNHGDGANGLAACQASCLGAAASMCNAVNYSPSAQDCVWRVCVDPLHPQLSGGNGDYQYYGTNSSTSALISDAWHADVGVLAALCSADPACGGFSLGAAGAKLFTNTTATRAAPGTTLYARKASE